MTELFHVVLYQPIYNLFIGFYDVVPDVGLVILVLTVIIKLVLYPLTSKSIKAQKSLTDLQPKMEEIKKKYKDDQQQQAQEMMKLYKEHKVNPAGSCLPILVQLPIFLALYWVLRDGLNQVNPEVLYSFVPVPENLDPVTLGLFDLSKVSPVLAVAAGAAQFWQAKMFTKRRPPKKLQEKEGAKDENMMAIMNKQMLYFMPLMTLLIGMTLPGGLALYWFLSTLLTALQQKILFKKHHDDEENGSAGKKDGDVIEGEVVEEKKK